MTYDRTEFDAAREAGKAKQAARRLAHSLATRIRASQYTHGDGDLTVHDDALAEEYQASAVAHRDLSDKTPKGERHMSTAHAFRNKADGAWGVAHRPRGRHPYHRRANRPVRAHGPTPDPRCREQAFARGDRQGGLRMKRVQRWLRDRCAHCGHRFRWRKDVRIGFGNRNGREVFHDPCMGYVIWRRKAEERLDMLAVVCEVWNVTDRDVRGVVEMRTADNAEGAVLRDRAFRVFYDLKNRAEITEETP